MYNKVINKNDSYDMNRGVEFILKGGKKKQPKLMHMVFEKLVCFFKREVTIYFEFYIRTNRKK